MTRLGRHQDAAPAVSAHESSADDEDQHQGSSEYTEEEDNMIRVGEQMLQAVCMLLSFDFASMLWWDLTQRTESKTSRFKT